MKRFFVTGISTDVGKTIVSAIITEAMNADYWKPIQAGNIDDSDTTRVKQLISNTKSVMHSSRYVLRSPMSPHAAAALDGVQIQVSEMAEPETSNHLVIEGAGGLMVPLNEKETILDLIQPHYKVLVVSRHYLGSINHTLLTLEWLKLHHIRPYVIFSGDELPSTENIILRKTGVSSIGRIAEEKNIDKEIILRYASELLPALKLL